MLDPAVQESQIVEPDYDPPVQAAHFGSDDTVTSDGNGQRRIEVDEHVRRIDAQPASVVEDTQFVNLEIDTQAPEKTPFKIPGSASTSIVLDTQTFLHTNEPLFARPAEASLDDINIGFKFGKPSKVVPGQFSLNPNLRKASATSAASDENREKHPVQAASVPNDQPAPFCTTAGSINVETAPSNINITAPAPNKPPNATTQPSDVTRPSKSIHSPSTTSDQTSTIHGSTGTKTVSVEPPIVKQGAKTPQNTSVISDIQKSTIQSHHQTDASTKGLASPSRTKRLDSPPPQQNTAVQTAKTVEDDTVQEHAPKVLSNRAVPELRIVEDSAVDRHEPPKRVTVKPEVAGKGQPAPRSAAKQPTRRKTLVREGNFKGPPPHRTSRYMARPFPEVQIESKPVRQPVKPKSKPANDTRNHSPRHLPDGIQQDYPLENYTALVANRAGSEQPQNIEAHPITLRLPLYDAVDPPPVPRAGAPSPAPSMASQRSNMSARISRPPSTSFAETSPRPQVLRATHNSKVSKPPSKPLFASISSVKLKSAKVIETSPNTNDVQVPLVVNQAASCISQEPEDLPVDSTSERTAAVRDVQPKPKKLRESSPPLETWVWRESLAKVYEKTIAALEIKVAAKDEQFKSIQEKMKGEEEKGNKELQSYREEFKSKMRALEENKKKLQSKDEQISFMRNNLQSKEKKLQSLKQENDLLRQAKMKLEDEKSETKEKVEKWDRLNKSLVKHMNKVVEAQNTLLAKAPAIRLEAHEIRMTANEIKDKETAVSQIANILEDIKVAKAELRSAAEAEKDAAKFRNNLKQVEAEKAVIDHDLQVIKHTVESQKAAIDKYLLDLQEEKTRAAKLQKQLEGEMETHAKLISSLDGLPRNVTAELRKEDGPLTGLLSTQTSLQNKIDTALEVLNELKTHEAKPSSSLLKRIEELFAQIPQPSTPPPDERASTEQVISKLFDELKTSLNKFISDSQTQINLAAQITELQKNNSTLSANVSSVSLEKDTLTGQLEDTRRQVNDYRNQLELKTQELEAVRALPKEDPRLVAKIEELEGANLGFQRQLQELTRVKEENLTLQEKVGEYENQCSRHEKEKQELRDCFIAEKKKDNEIAEKVRKESTFQSDRKIKSLKQTLQEVESELNQLKPKSTTQLENIKKLTEEVERSRKAQEISKAETQKHTNELTSEIDILQNQVWDLKAELANSMKLSQVAAEKEVLLKQISEVNAELKDKASLLDLLGSPRDMLRKNSQKTLTRREIPETQSNQHTDVIELHQEEFLLPTKRRPSGRWGRTKGNGISSREVIVIPDSQSQGVTGVRSKHAGSQDLGSSQEQSSQPIQSTPLKSFSVLESGRSSAMSELTDVDEFMPISASDDDCHQLSQVYEKARIKKSSRESSDPNGDLENIRAKNKADRAKRRPSQPSHRTTSSAQLKSVLKASSTSLKTSTDPGAQEGMGATADQPIRKKLPPAPRGNPYNRVASGFTSTKHHQVPQTSPIHNGGVSRRNGTGLGHKRKADSELVSPKASKAPATRTSSYDRSKMPPPPARRPSTRSASIPPPEPNFPPARLSLPPPTEASKPRTLVRKP